MQNVLIFTVNLTLPFTFHLNMCSHVSMACSFQRLDNVKMKCSKFVLPSLLISSFYFIHFSTLHAFSLYFLFYPYSPHNFPTSEEQLLSYHYIKSLIDSLICLRSPLVIVPFVLHFNQLHSSFFCSCFELCSELTTVWYLFLSLRVKITTF